MLVVESSWIVCPICGKRMKFHKLESEMYWFRCVNDHDEYFRAFTRDEEDFLEVSLIDGTLGITGGV